jgi:hypothetical protein
MKQLILFGAMLLAAAGCAQQEETAPAPAAAAAPEVAEAVPAAASAMEPDAYYEYLWCQQGEDYSQESMTELTTNWNAVIDGMGTPPLAAFGYMPRGWESEDFDGLWVLRWNSKADSAAGWAAYAASEAGVAHEAKYTSVLACGNEVGADRFGFNTYIPQPMPATFTGEPGPYYLTNMFCAMNEGKGPEDLRAAVGEEYLPMLAAGADANPESSYWFSISAPDFEVNPEAPMDFNWVNYWQTAEEGEAASAAFAASEAGQAMQASFNDVATCQDPQPWDGYLIRSAPAS